MALASDRSAQPIALSFDKFLAQYGDDSRYELIDGELFDLEPTGPHEQVAATIVRGSITTSCSKGPITSSPIAA